MARDGGAEVAEFDLGFRGAGGLEGVPRMVFALVEDVDAALLQLRGAGEGILQRDDVRERRVVVILAGEAEQEVENPTLTNIGLS